MKWVVFVTLGLGALWTAIPAKASGWTPPADHEIIRIWPGGAPGARTLSVPEGDISTARDGLTAGKPVFRLGNVSDPTITIYRPPKRNTGAAVVVFPGGGYHILAIDLEGSEACDWFSSKGITCVLLKYRVPDSGPYPKYRAALQDAQRALGVVRQHATEWQIDSHRVGVLGFSAGGHLAASLSSHFHERVYQPIDDADQLSCRPDFSVLIYPGYLAFADQQFASNPDVQPAPDTPPTFLVQTEDDPVHVENAVVYFLTLKQAKIPAELHIYSDGGHGYGLRRTLIPVTGWPQLLEIWLHTIGIVTGSLPA